MKATQIIPALVYADAKAAIHWLRDAFGFKEHLVVPDGKDGIAHAELILGQVMIMLGSSGSGSEYHKLTKTPTELGGYQSQSPYIIVDDPDAFYEKAQAHGAKIVIDIKDEDYGGRGFTCADPEGHLWSFGSYDPWKQV